MSPLRLPLQLLLTIFAGWINRQQLDVIEYLKEENRLLKERMGGRRTRFTDAERRRLARKAQVLGRKLLSELETLVTPDTLLRWHRQLVAAKWNFSHRRGPGRPRVLKTLVDLILRMAHENPSWGYTRIRGALANLGHDVGRGTIDIASRSVKIAGITPHPDTRWMMQMARNLIDVDDGFLRGTRYLILDRDTKYSDEFRNALDREGIHLIRLPPRSPNLNALAERFVRSIKSECLDRMIFFGQASLQHAISQFMAHYHAERNHQGLGNRLVRPEVAALSSHHSVQRRQRLGGMLNYYHRAAA